MTGSLDLQMMSSHAIRLRSWSGGVARAVGHPGHGNGNGNGNGREERSNATQHNRRESRSLTELVIVRLSEEDETVIDCYCSWG